MNLNTHGYWEDWERSVLLEKALQWMRKTLFCGELIGRSIPHVAALPWAWAGSCRANVDLAMQQFHGQFTALTWIRLHPSVQIGPQCSPKWRWKNLGCYFVWKCPIFLFAWTGGSSSLEHNLVKISLISLQCSLEGLWCKGFLVGLFPRLVLVLFYSNREVRDDGRMWFKMGIFFRRKIIYRKMGILNQHISLLKNNYHS